MRVNHRRSDVEIIAEMLRIGQNNAPKTRLMYCANMSHSQMEKYLRFLLNNGYLGAVSGDNPSVTYQSTERGRDLLRRIDGFLEMLGLSD